MTATFDKLHTRTRDGVFGGIGDDVRTGLAPLAPRAVEGRTEVLETLFDYLCELTFYRSGGKGKPPIAFQLRREECFTEWPENVDELQFPSLGVLPGDSQHLPIGLAPVVDESTQDKFGMGTVVWRLWDYQEVLQIEVWASSRAERRALIYGLEQALSPSENVSNLRLLIPSYFNQRASYMLQGVTRNDDNAVKNRRLARFKLQVNYDVVRHARYAAMIPAVYSEVQDGSSSDPNTPGAA